MASLRVLEYLFGEKMKRALLIVDVQNDFLPGGSLAVPCGDSIVGGINSAMDSFEFVVATQDWHPPNHGSFAVNHPGKGLFETVELGGLPQCLWPVHCVQGTPGAELCPSLRKEKIGHVSRKGTDPEIDSYSGFFDNGRMAQTDLDGWLRSRGVDTLCVCGLATDYCVKATALDAVSLGYRTILLGNLCRGVNLNPDDTRRAVMAMSRAGVMLGRQ